MIIGVTGLTGSGKGALCKILAEKGFIKLGHSEIINEELKKRGLEITRDNQVMVANEMRKIHGIGYWARELIKKIELEKDYVVEGFRNIAEVEEFRKIPGFFLIGIAAGFRRRFNWVMKRARPGDPTNLKEFIQNEKRDFFQFDKPEGQQNAICFSMADYYIANEGSFEELKKKADELIGELKTGKVNYSYFE